MGAYFDILSVTGKIVSAQNIQIYQHGLHYCAHLNLITIIPTTSLHLRITSLLLFSSQGIVATASKQYVVVRQQLNPNLKR